eukprot:1027396_1
MEISSRSVANIVCIIEDIVVQDRYSDCDDSTAFVVVNLFEYYYKNWLEESEWEALLHLSESVIPYFYKHALLSQQVIWTDIIQNTVLKDARLQLQVSLILLLIKHCGVCNDTSVLMETKLLLQRYIIDYAPNIECAHHEYMELQRMTSALQLIQGNKRKRRKSRSKSKSSDRLSSQIESYYTESKLSREEEVARTELMWNLDRLWKKVLFESSPSAAAAASDDAHTFITLFGSVATHLEDRAAKSIDIYLKVPSQLNSNELQKDQNELLKHLATELNANGLTSSGIVDCTAPSIAVMVDETHIHICYDEHNDKSKMVQLVNALCQYKEHDTRIKALIVCIKHWSKQRNLNSSINKFNNKSRLSSFCLMLLIFKYLQTDDVLPILKKQRQFNRYKVLLDVDDKSNEYNTYLNKSKSTKKRSKIRKIY